MRSFIGYLRVSTKGQGESGLGLEAQRATLDDYVRQAGGVLLTVYVEIESGTRADRPELAKALAHAKRSRATLCVAKLDRLSRNVEFLARVLNSRVEFAAADMPSANTFMLHVMAAVAEHEAKAISERTKAALAARRARGGKLGAEMPRCRNLRPEDRLKGARNAGAAVARAANEAYSDLRPAMLQWRAEGATLAGIATRLNGQGQTTRTGKRWSATQVSRVLNRGSA